MDNGIVPQNSVMLKMSILSFNGVFLLLLLVSFFLFSLGSGGMTLTMETGGFIFLFLFFLLLSSLRVSINYFRGKKLIIVSKKSFVFFVVAIIVLSVYIIFFNVGDCGDSNGLYNIIKKIVIHGNVCQKSTLDGMVVIGFLSIFVSFIAYFLLIWRFWSFVNSKAIKI